LIIGGTDSLPLGAIGADCSVVSRSKLTDTGGRPRKLGLIAKCFALPVTEFDPPQVFAVDTRKHLGQTLLLETDWFLAQDRVEVEFSVALNNHTHRALTISLSVDPERTQYFGEIDDVAIFKADAQAGQLKRPVNTVGPQVVALVSKVSVDRMQQSEHRRQD
jgi:hypothetical protein